MKQSLSIALIIALFVGTLPAHAASPCSIDHAYPEVSMLSIEDGRLVATLGTYFAHHEYNADRQYTPKYPRLSMSVDGTWQPDGLSDEAAFWEDRPRTCLDAPSDLEGAWNALQEDEKLYSTLGAAAEYFQQSITSCATDGNNLWGGISYYGSEGDWGVGGLVRMDLNTEDIEFIRSKKQLHRSTEPLAYFAGELWMGLTVHRECGGPPPGYGMQRLKHWKPNPDIGMKGFYTVEDVPQVCGFAVRDFQEFGGALWAATELGLSKLTDNNGPVWTNYMPDLNDPGLFREITCDDLYTELLSSSEFADTAGFNIGNAFDIFWQRLAAQRPQFLTQYLRELHGHPTEDYPRGFD